MKFISQSFEETTNFGEKIGKCLSKSVISLYGEMGSGKTTFVKGVCKGLGYKGDCFSPTFSIVNEYIGGKLPIYHFDMYRILNEDDLYSCGFFDYLDTDCLIIIEWSENISNYLPEKNIKISFEKDKNDFNKRIINIEGLNCENFIN